MAVCPQHDFYPRPVAADRGDQTMQPAHDGESDRIDIDSGSRALPPAERNGP
jgi:hypothetical protein